MNTDVAKIEQETKDMMTQIMSINKSIVRFLQHLCSYYSSLS